MACLMYVFIYRFIYFVYHLCIYVYLLNHSFNLLFVYLCIYFIYFFIHSFVLSLHCSTIHLLIDRFNCGLLISSPVNTELFNSTKEKCALGRPSGRCDGNNKTDVRIGYMQMWTGYSWQIL